MGAAEERHNSPARPQDASESPAPPREGPSIIVLPSAQERISALAHSLRPEKKDASDERPSWRTLQLHDQPLWRSLSHIAPSEADIRSNLESAFLLDTFDRYHRATGDFEEALLEMYLRGISADKLEHFTQALDGLSVSKDAIYNAFERRHSSLKAWNERPLRQPYPYLYLGETTVRVDQDGAVRKLPLLVVVGISDEGYREILATHATSNREDGWRYVLDDLKGRGLNDVRLCISEHHPYLNQAVDGSLPSSQWQSCVSHVKRLVLSHVPRPDARGLGADVGKIFTAHRLDEAMAMAEFVAEHRLKAHPEAVATLERDLDAALTYIDFPRQHHRRVRTVGMLRRLFREVRHRTEIAGVFPDGETAAGLSASMMLGIQEDWSERRYLSSEPMHGLVNPGRPLVARPSPRHETASKVEVMAEPSRTEAETEEALSAAAREESPRTAEGIETAEASSPSSLPSQAKEPASLKPEALAKPAAVEDVSAEIADAVEKSASQAGDGRSSLGAELKVQTLADLLGDLSTPTPPSTSSSEPPAAPDADAPVQPDAPEASDSPSLSATFFFDAKATAQVAMQPAADEAAQPDAPAAPDLPSLSTTFFFETEAPASDVPTPAAPGTANGTSAEAVHDPLAASPPAVPESEPVQAEAAPKKALPPADREEFEPIKKGDHHSHAQQYNPSVYGRRIAIFGSISVVLSALVYLFMEDPFGWLLDYTGRRIALSWSGLFVYSSIIALILFLCTLLLRYFALMGLAYINTAKHTSMLKVDDDPDAFQPPISIMVPVYNEGMMLKATIDSLVKLDYPAYEVIIIDDGSSDNTRNIAQELIGVYDNVEVKLIEKPNGGKSSALNCGIQCATHDFVLCVDGDSVLSPDTLLKTIRHMADDRVAAVAGNVKVINRSNIWTKLQALEYVEGLNMSRAAQSIVKKVNIIPGPLGLFRKEAIIEAGWYNSDTFAEDCDITLQIIRNGWKVQYEPDAISFTEAPNKLTHLLKQRYRWTRGIIQAIRKHNDLVFNPSINIGGSVVLWTMVFESLVWPIMNIFGNLYFIFVALVFDLSPYLVLWWVTLTILDLVAALYCVAVEKEEARLIFYAIFYRLFFILIIDVCKMFATVEEFLGLGMDWGKLERIGTINQPSS